MITEKKKIIVILGPTASGKTGLAVRLAHKFNGEIVSADSRQVYKGMDVGTGKDLREYNVKCQMSNVKCKIPYHLIDVVSPKTEFNLAKYQKLAYKAIDDILRRGKLPILVGGSGLYLQAVVDGYELRGKGVDKKLRRELEKMNVEELFSILKRINPKWAQRLNESDRKNKRRLARYLEILESRKDAGLLHEIPQSGFAFGGISQGKRGKGRYDALIIGPAWPKEVLEKRIYKRLIERLEKEDMIGEVRRLFKEGVSWKRLESLGLEYKYVALYLQKKLIYEEMVEKLFIAIRQFSRRQLTWFRRWERQGREIQWVKNKSEAARLIKIFLK